MGFLQLSWQNLTSDIIHKNKQFVYRNNIITIQLFNQKYNVFHSKPDLIFVFFNNNDKSKIHGVAFQIGLSLLTVKQYFTHTFFSFCEQ